jgi:hypothetical protein
MIVDGTAGYIYNTVTHAFAQIADPDFPANPATVTYLGRRFVVSIQDSSRFQVSDIDDGLSWDALNFANAEVSPDQIVRAYASNGQLILPGYLVTEFWGNSGTADFPFSQLQGTANEWGLAARYSIARFDNTFCMLVQNRMGQVMIGKMNGYLPEKISSQDMDFVIVALRRLAESGAMVEGQELRHCAASGRIRLHVAWPADRGRFLDRPPASLGLQRTHRQRRVDRARDRQRDGCKSGLGVFAGRLFARRYGSWQRHGNRAGVESADWPIRIARQRQDLGRADVEDDGGDRAISHAR